MGLKRHTYKKQIYQILNRVQLNKQEEIYKYSEKE